MTNREPRYDALFEPIDIGPVTSKNRFYTVPHALCMGFAKLDEMIAYRRARAEGGWGAVCTGETYIHETSDHAPLAVPSLASDSDIEPMSRVTAAIKEHGALAGVELTHAGASGPAWYSRSHPIAPSPRFPRDFINPIGARKMDKRDIKEFRQWYVAAALRAKMAGFDIIYAYCSHDFSLLQHFLMSRSNKRDDEYGGALENRMRLLREVVSDLKDAVGNSCAVALRFAVEDRQESSSLNAREDGLRVVESLANLPDLWDVNVSDWAWDSGSSRFFKEGQQEPFVDFVKRTTDKPVVGVGRFTSPDSMVSQLRRGVIDIVGAARPSISDPFLPNKIDEGKHDEIRECIGCNVCAAELMNFTKIRCTQNPAVGEEHRRGWHPEILSPAHDNTKSILVVGGGPAGLEAALTFGKRGYNVAIAEAANEWGGRLAKEVKLPRLSEWIRVVDYRIHQLQQMANVELYLSSRLSADDVVEFDADHVVVATGATWRRDGTGRSHDTAIVGYDSPHVYSPDDIMNGVDIVGDVVVYDEDYYYMASAVAEKLATLGCDVTYVTSASIPSPWSVNTLEFEHVVRSMNKLAIRIVTGTTLSSIDKNTVQVVRSLSGEKSTIATQNVVLVTGQMADDSLYYELADLRDETKIRSLVRIGDCVSPAFIAQATHDGRKAGMEFGKS